MTNRVAETLNYEVDSFSRNLIQRTAANREELDGVIRNNLVERRFERIPVLDIVLIRLAVSELLYFEDIPVEVTIDEAIELSKDFISHKGSRFINGVIDSILKSLQEKKQLNKNLVARISYRLNQDLESRGDFDS